MHFFRRRAEERMHVSIIGWLLRVRGECQRQDDCQTAPTCSSDLVCQCCSPGVSSGCAIRCVYIPVNRRLQPNLFRGAITGAPDVQCCHRDRVAG